MTPPANALTYEQVGFCLNRLGNWRVIAVQDLSPHLYAWYLGLGLRETKLLNEEGGALWDAQAKKWVKAALDAGWTQISRTAHPDELKRMVAVKAETWGPKIPGHTPFQVGYCPRFSDCLEFTDHEFKENYGWIKSERPGEALIFYRRFATAAHNAGLGGAIKGLKEGNIDLYTALHDYSGWVAYHVPMIERWIAEHPNWQPH